MGLVQLIRARIEGKPSIDLEEFRTGKPVRNARVQESPGEKGDVILTLPVESIRKTGWSTFLKTRSLASKRQFELDEVGAFVWSCCDGKSSFEKISRALQSKYKMSRLEAEVSLAAYLRTLGQRGLISFLVRSKQ